MKRALSPALGASILIIAAAGLLSCGGPAAPKKGKVILSTFYPMHVMVLNLARGAQGVDAELLAQPTVGCLHDYSLSAGDMMKIDAADILVANGAGMESFLQDVAARKPALRSIMLAENSGVTFDAGAAVNPHAWVSPALYAVQVRALADFLVAADPENAEVYKKNGGEYALRIEALDRRMHAALAPYAGRKIVTFHEAFPYFAEEFGFEVAAVVEREPGTEPSAAELAAAIDTVRAAKVAAVFVEPQYPRGPADAIARETGVKVLVLDPASTPKAGLTASTPKAGLTASTPKAGLTASTPAGSADLDSYIAEMEGNLASLLAAFGGGGK